MNEARLLGVESLLKERRRKCLVALAQLQGASKDKQLLVMGGDRDLKPYGGEFDSIPDSTVQSHLIDLLHPQNLVLMKHYGGNEALVDKIISLPRQSEWWFSEVTERIQFDNRGIMPQELIRLFLKEKTRGFVEGWKMLDVVIVVGDIRAGDQLEAICSEFRLKRAVESDTGT